MDFLSNNAELASALPGTYDPAMVVLSILIASLGSYGALELVDRIKLAKGRFGKSIWLTAGALTLGSAVWCVHLTGMLAFSQPLAATYKLTTTLSSMIPAIFASAVALYVLSRARVTKKHLIIGGALTGAGIGAMHYLGVTGLNMDAIVRYDPAALAASIIIAMALASIALTINLLAKNSSLKRYFGWLKVGGALALGLAITGIHYTAMTAVRFFPAYAPAGQVAHTSATQGINLNPEHLTLLSGLVALGIFALALAAGAVARRFEKTLATLDAEISERRAAEKALQQSRVLFQSVIDNSPVHLTVKDTQGHYLLVSKSYEEWWGRTTEEIIGKKADDLLGDIIEVEKLRASEDLVLETGQVVEKVVEVEGSDGDLHDWLLIKFPIRAPDGSIEAIGTVAIDVTDQKALEETERQSREMLEKVIEASPVGIACISRDRKVMLWSRAAEQIFGYTAEEMVGKTYRLVSPDGAEQFDNYVERALAGETIRDLHVQRRHKDGHTIDVSIAVSPMYDPDGGIRGLAYALEDVTELRGAVKALQEQQALLQAIIDNTPFHLNLKDAEGRYLVVNKSFAEWWGRSPQEFIGKNIQDYMDDGDAAENLHFMESKVLDGAVIENEVRVKRPTGESLDWLVLKFPIKSQDGSIDAMGSISVDITDRKQAEELIQEQREQLDQILRNVPEAVITIDDQGAIETFNPSAESTFGYSANEAIGRNVKLLMPDRDKEHHDHHIKTSATEDHTKLNGPGPRQVTGLHKDGHEFPMELSIAKVGSNGKRGFVGVARDITEQRQIEARIAHLAHHDQLTGLPNRLMLRDRMEKMLTGGRTGDGGFALLCLDLDEFKGVNDMLGHPVGDELLEHAAERLRGCVREGDMVARLGGDEFAIVQNSKDQPRDAMELAKRICDVIGAPFDLKDHQISVGTSIGVAIAPDDGNEIDQLLNHADMALYRAKSEGRGSFHFFEAEMEASTKDRHALGLDLRKALTNNELEVYYQPIINLEKTVVGSFEALLRWHHPQRGIVSPGEFIPIAEKIGLINQMGEWVLRQACAEALNWPDDIKIAVNASPAQFKGGGLLPAVVNALTETGLPAERLELEITESVLLLDDKATLETLHQLRNLGVHISLDDFGTGYSSLSYLRSFPFDKIKIDRSFVSNLTEADEGVDIVQTIVGFATSLNVATVAEGVETEQQLDIIRKKGCTEAQGYLFSPPRPAQEVLRFLSRQSVRAEDAA